MKTVSINVMNLCVPCANRCRYCLLSYDGRVSGVDFGRSTTYARRFFDWINKNRPDLSFLFGFGYSMEHPDLLDAIDFCQSIGSASGEFLQFDGMRFRTDEELEILLSSLKDHGIKLIDLTFYGTEAYHDRFAGRRGDYDLMVRTLSMAQKVGLDITVSIPLTRENRDQAGELITQLKDRGTGSIRCFVPHGEGRGQLLEPIRLSLSDYEALPESVRSLLNRERFKTEKEWLLSGFPTENKRVLTVTLTPDNVDFFENLPFGDTIAWLEKLDEDYYSTVPAAEELARRYGDPTGEKLYSARDLFLTYQRRFLAEHRLDVYDMNDERHCFSRRF